MNELGKMVVFVMIWVPSSQISDDGDCDGSFLKSTLVDLLLQKKVF